MENTRSGSVSVCGTNSVLQFSNTLTYPQFSINQCQLNRNTALNYYCGENVHLFTSVFYVDFYYDNIIEEILPTSLQEKFRSMEIHAELLKNGASA